MIPGGPGGAPPQRPVDLTGPYLGEMALEYRHQGVETAAVYFYANGSRVVVRSDGRQVDRVPRMRRPSAISRVALGLHHTRAEEQLPAAGGGRFFRAELDVVWEVTDPVRVAERQLRDVRILLPELLHRLRSITARHRISDLDAASDQISRYLESSHRASVGADYGIDARVYVRLDLDEAEIKGIGQIDDDEWQARLEAQRRARLLNTLAGGDLERAAALTAADPANLSTAISMLTDSDRTNRQEMIRFFQYMVDTGTVSRSQLSQQAQAMLVWVQGGGDPSVPLSVGWDRAIETAQPRPPLAIGSGPDPGAGRSEPAGGASSRRKPTARNGEWWQDLDAKPEPERKRHDSEEAPGGWGHPPADRHRDAPVTADRGEARSGRSATEDPRPGPVEHGGPRQDEPPVHRFESRREERSVDRGGDVPRGDARHGDARHGDARHGDVPRGDARYADLDRDPRVWHVESRRVDSPPGRARGDDWADSDVEAPSRKRRDDWEDDEWGR